MKYRRHVAALVLMIGLGLTSQEAYLRAKEGLAHHLLAAAWRDTTSTGRPQRPWPWADVVSIARLEFIERRQERIVLSGATDANLAFGVGHVDGTAAVGTSGNVALAGHKDGAFALLEHLRRGEVVRLVTLGGARHYTVESTQVVDPSAVQWLADHGDDRLTLVTCHPFTATWDSPERFVVVCRAVGDFTRHGATNAPPRADEDQSHFLQPARM